uniref:Methyltransferase domain-containing protein n=1 Tax=viral metagenome TaxID=1070528 RepID=A0A6C0AKR3_9ZZZZ
MMKVIFLVLLFILVIHLFYKYCIYKLMLSLGKYDFPIDVSNNELYKWDKLYYENKDAEGNYYDKVDYNSSKWCVNEKSHNAIILRPSYFHNTYYYETKIMDIKNDDVILDCGFGNGDFCEYLMSNYKNITYYGISNSKTQVDFVKNRFKNNKNINIIFDTYDNLKKHFNKPTINKVFFIESHGYSNNRLELFKQVYNLLLPGGKMYIKSPCFKPNTNKNIVKNNISVWAWNWSLVDANLYDMYKAGFSNIKYKNKNYSSLLISYSMKLFLSMIYVLFNLCNGYLYKKYNKFYTLPTYGLFKTAMNLDILVSIAEK